MKCFSNGGSRVRLLALAAVVALAALPAVAGDEAPAAADPAAETASVPAPAAADAVVVRWNPVSQEMEAPAAAARAELARRLQEMFAAELGKRMPVDEPTVKTLPNGAVALRLPLSQLETAVVRVGADGALAPSCVDGLAEAARLTAEPRDVTTPSGPAAQ